MHRLIRLYLCIFWLCGLAVPGLSALCLFILRISFIWFRPSQKQISKNIYVMPGWWFSFAHEIGIHNLRQTKTNNDKLIYMPAFLQVIKKPFKELETEWCAQNTVKWCAQTSPKAIILATAAICYNQTSNAAAIMVSNDISPLLSWSILVSAVAWH